MEILKSVMRPDNEIEYVDSIELLYTSRKWTTEPSDTKEMTILRQ